MEIKEAERVVIAKPVPSRPTCSSFRSFSELLAGAINVSPFTTSSENTIAAIRPKTVRFKPIVNHSPSRDNSSQADFSETAVCNLSVTKTDSKTNVLYKPQAKLVSKATVSLLANMGNFSTNSHQVMQLAHARVQNSNQDKHNFMSRFCSNMHQCIPSHTEAELTIGNSKTAAQNLEEDQKTSSVVVSSDRPSYDGYNWRKYGQKQVKGSEYPRSYYKCTHPNCPVKKKVERSFDGQIAEIVYKGEHNHPKPPPPKRSSSGTQGLVLASEGSAQDGNISLPNNQLNERTEGSEGRVENQNEMGLSCFQGRYPPAYEPTAAGTIHVGTGNSENSLGLSGECEEGSKVVEGDDDEPRSKRRKNENQSNEAGLLGESVQDPHVIVHGSTDSEILDDGFRWRKYGQKHVKGNPYPRSYYRCTSLKCNVRKHVERASDDPVAFITTYEGKHNHDMPMRNTTNPVASEPDS